MQDMRGMHDYDVMCMFYEHLKVNCLKCCFCVIERTIAHTCMNMTMMWLRCCWKVNSHMHPHTWLCMKYVCLWYICCVDWKAILMNTLWIWCERFTHMLMILRLKGHSHLMNLWAIMISYWFECLEHSFMNMNLSKDLIWI